MNAIDIRGLKKSFRGLYALDGLDMTVPEGAIYGFIGENGSGKSTTEKLGFFSFPWMTSVSTRHSCRSRSYPHLPALQDL